MESATSFINNMSSTEIVTENGTSDAIDDFSNITQGNISYTSISSNITIKLYIYVVPVLMFICLISFLVNLKILVASRWLRKPISPNLKINMSLAGADAYASFCIGFGLFVNSWLPVLRMKPSTNMCPMLILEGLRLGGIITVVFHILFLSINHYAGIVKPLHYQGIITGKHTNFALISLWIVPPLSFLVYFALLTDDGFNKVNCGYEFLRRWDFRIAFFGLFLAPFTLMVYIYIHIFAIVRRHQQMRKRFARTGPVQGRRDSTRAINSSMDLQRNLKAIWTTLLMLGSYLIGWLPGLLYFILVCENCFYPLNYFTSITTFSVCVVTNLFIILKTLLNPIIYAARISDVKVATLKMNIYLRNLIRNYQRRRENDSRQHRMTEISGQTSECLDTTTTRMMRNTDSSQSEN